MTDFSDLDAVATQGSYDNLLLVDGLNLAFRYRHKKQRNFGADYLRTIMSFAKSYSATKVIVHADWGSSVYRKNIDERYKGNRSEKYKEQTPEEAESFKLFIEDFNAAMDLCAECYPVVRYKGVEADDTIAYVAEQAQENFEHVWLISSDRDFDQLISEKVSRFSYVTRKEVTVSNFYETYGCSPEQYISMKVLMGDSGDNVPGVALVGEKRAALVVRQYGSALDIYDQLPLEGTQQFIKNINEFGPQILTNYELMDLSFCSDAIGLENLITLNNLLKENNIC